MTETEEEIVDIYDENMNRIGAKPRNEVHKTGDWHKSFHCWIIRKQGDRQYVLFQKRGPNKKIYPNALDITAAGHYLKGENIEKGIRELNEELGTSFAYSDLVHLGTKIDVAKIGDIINREFCEVYLLENPLPPSGYRIKEDEVTGLVEIEVRDGMKLFSGEVARTKARGITLETGKQERTFDIGVSDIIPRVDRYYMKIFIMTERYFQRLKYLGV
jgi:isopentenyldiphosphate isomerase